MFKVIFNIWDIRELRLKIIFTLMYLLIYRFASYVPIPGISPKGVVDFLSNTIINPGVKGLMQVLSSFTGGAFNRASILALGIMPYISSSIIIQLMTLAIPSLQKMQKDGESGRKQINSIIRWLTLLIALIQAPAYIMVLTKKFIPFSSVPQAYFFDMTNFTENLLFFLLSIITLTTGTLFTMWLGEKISSNGIGNGVSLIIMSGILVKFPDSIIQEFFIKFKLGNTGLFFLLFEFILWLLVILLCIVIIQAVRKIPIQYVRGIQNVGMNNRIIITNNRLRKYIPLKIISSGVMPIIFSQAIMLLPVSLLSYSNNEKIKIFIESIQNIYGLWYNIIFSLLIILFTFFYTAITIPVNQIADDLKRNGAHILKIKPGKDTIIYLDKILVRITFLGSILLSIIAILPSLIIQIGVNHNFALFYGGTSLLIIIGVILDTVQQIDSYLLNKHYDGLMQNKISYINL